VGEQALADVVEHLAEQRRPGAPEGGAR